VGGENQWQCHGKMDMRQIRSIVNCTNWIRRAVELFWLVRVLPPASLFTLQMEATYDNTTRRHNLKFHVMDTAYLRQAQRRAFVKEVMNLHVPRRPFTFCLSPISFRGVSPVASCAAMLW